MSSENSEEMSVLLNSYLDGELSGEDVQKVESLLESSQEFRAEKEELEKMVSALQKDGERLDIGLSVNRKEKLFKEFDRLDQSVLSDDGNSQDSQIKNRIINIASRLKFTLAAAALILFSFSYYPEMWKSDSTLAPQEDVLGRMAQTVEEPSFTLDFESGLYTFTSSSAGMVLGEKKRKAGDDLFKNLSFSINDVLVSLDDISLKNISKNEFETIIKKALQKDELKVLIRRKGVLLKPVLLTK